MVKKSKKSKSKRVPLKKRYKIHQEGEGTPQKKAKKAKKLGRKHKNKVEKDPRISNDWPFKEQEPEALEAWWACALQELEQKKASQKETDDDMPKLADVASAKEQDFEEGKVTEEAFYKELVEVIEASDVILEVLNARDPLGTRCVDMKKMVMRSGPNKHLEWLKYLREELSAVAFKCSTQEQQTKLGWRSKSKAAKPSNLLQTSDCFGAETLIKLLKNYSRSHEIKKLITVLHQV
ncbi:hypothetical protein AAG906_008673 [Vitis piasezkii]